MSMGEAFNEAQALVFLQQPSLSAQMLDSLARNPQALKSRKVLLALIAHPRTPRHTAVLLLRRVFTFDLLQVALTPAVAADLKRAAEEQLLHRMEKLSLGEKTTLAKRGPGRVAAALLIDAERRVVESALDNSRLTEALVVRALMKPRAPEVLFELVSEHREWSLRRDVQIALLRSEKTPIARAQALAGDFPQQLLEEIVPKSRQAELGAAGVEDSQKKEESK